MSVAPLLISLRPLLPYLGVAALWQLFITVVGTIVSHSFTAATPVTLPMFAFDYATHWDGQWYLSIINGSYGEPGSFSPAFFPLFPLAIWLLQTLSFGVIDVTIIGLFLNTVLLTISLFMLSKISIILFPKTDKWILPLIFLLSPAAIFQNFFYTEALFCALGFSAYYLSLRRNWALMGVVLIFVTATRLPGVLIVGLCGLEYLRAHNWSVRSALGDKNVLWFLLAPIGAVSYAAYLHVVRGDMLAMFHSQRLWSYHEFNINIFDTYLRSTQTIVHNLINPNEIGYVLVVSQLLPLLSIAIVYAASIYLLVKRIHIPLAVYGIVAAVFFSLNSNVVSVHRYMLGVLTVHVVLLLIYQSKRSHFKALFFACMYVSVLIQAILLFLFANNYFAG